MTLAATSVCRLVLHEEGGPCRWAVQQLLALGRRSPRMLALAATQARPPSLGIESCT